MTPAAAARVAGRRGNGSVRRPVIPAEYFDYRDFEYVQPLYDLAFLLEVGALAEGAAVPKYRTFSLWRAAHSLDGYSSCIARWLRGDLKDGDLDFVPSKRIREYLVSAARAGTLPELFAYRGRRARDFLRLRSVRGLGPAKIATLPRSAAGYADWLDGLTLVGKERAGAVARLVDGGSGPWQSAHVVPPLLRLLHAVEPHLPAALGWDIPAISNPFDPVDSPLTVHACSKWRDVERAVRRALRRDRQFRVVRCGERGPIILRHQLGWCAAVTPATTGATGASAAEWAAGADPMTRPIPAGFHSDLHMHTTWSDGSASPEAMALAARHSGLDYIAITDHSRSCKLQGGLTPPSWLRQAQALRGAAPALPILHGIEVDILQDGSLDMPAALLRAADLVVASVHTNWTTDVRANTRRLLLAIESGCVDILAHPTSAITGKPGVPDYSRPPASVDWNQVFRACARWRVAVEMNCFPSRLDLPLPLLRDAVRAGCVISYGSDAHARSHLANLRFGASADERVRADVVLNRMPVAELTRWVRDARALRAKRPRTEVEAPQLDLFPGESPHASSLLAALVSPPAGVPDGAGVVGIDLTAGEKPTGIAYISGRATETASVGSDEEILCFIRERRPAIVSIDSPLGLPGGGAAPDPSAGIMRVAELDLASIGIPAYPSLIDSMRDLTLRGIRLRRRIESLPQPPRVIESYPGAAQDILCIPRKQRGLALLRHGLRRLGLTGPGLETESDDEMDAITSAIVGRYVDAGAFEAMGISSEAQLLVPSTRPLLLEQNPVICLAGKTGAGKSVAARYLAVFYGFRWIRTRDLVRELLVEDLAMPASRRKSRIEVDPALVSERELREFGALLLNEYHQEPLRRKLAGLLAARDEPTVVDSVRDFADVDASVLGERPRWLWFVEAGERAIAGRLRTRSKFGRRRTAEATAVDRTADLLAAGADVVIQNNRSLEDFRWRLDDALMGQLRIVARGIESSSSGGRVDSARPASFSPSEHSSLLRPR